jgi:hypothetical protein
MEIRQAKDASESSTLKAAKQSDFFAIGLAAAGFICCAGWFVTPKDIKEKITPIALAGFGGVGFVFKMKLVQIKDGRLAIGDLNEAVTNYALLKPDEEMRLAAVGEFVAGRKNIAEMPIVQSAINTEVAQRVSDRIGELERVAAAKETLVKPRNVLKEVSNDIEMGKAQVALSPVSVQRSSRIIPDEVI